MSEIWSIPSLHKSGAQKPPFRPTLQLKGNLTAYIFRVKHDIDRDLLHYPKMS